MYETRGAPPSVCLSVCLSVCRSVCGPVCQSVSQSVLVGLAVRVICVSYSIQSLSLSRGVGGVRGDGLVGVHKHVGPPAASLWSAQHACGLLPRSLLQTHSHTLADVRERDYFDVFEFNLKFKILPKFRQIVRTRKNKIPERIQTFIDV
jgi:hypothetical protein